MISGENLSVKQEHRVEGYNYSLVGLSAEVDSNEEASKHHVTSNHVEYC